MPDRRNGDVLRRVEASRVAAWAAANREVLSLCWSIGSDLMARPAMYGDAVLDRLAGDLAGEFPEQSVWTVANLRHMRKAASTWPDLDVFLAERGPLSWSSVVRTLLDGAETT